MTEQRIGRRAVLQGGLAAAAGALVGVGGRAAWDSSRGDGSGPPSVPTRGEPAIPQPDAAGAATVAFHGARQAGVGTPAQAFAWFVALDLFPGTDRDALVRLMRVWTDDIRRLTRGRPGLADAEPELAAVPARLTVTLGYGPAIFMAAGLEHLRPAWLAPLPAFGVDRLTDSWCGGDLLLQVCADDPVTVSHAVRVLAAQARTFTTVRWVQRGFRRAAGTTRPGTTMRNLMGQLDGTRNPVPGIDDDLVWHGAGAPAWLAGGTSMVVRRIRMDLDGWDQVDRPAREAIIGRRLADGSPLTGRQETDVPDLDAVDALGFPAIDVAAHIRRARAADPAVRILRRGYNYDDAGGPGAPPDRGLVFIAFQRDVTAQYVPLQRRLDELDLLNRWTTPVGSAVFAVPGGCAEGEHLGQRLLQA